MLAIARVSASSDSLGSQPFDIGLIVTNTRFTPTAQWIAKQLPHIVKLKDFAALRAWLYDEFEDEVWKEIPDSITLAPGLTIQIPKVMRKKRS